MINKLPGLFIATALCVAVSFSAKAQTNFSALIQSSSGDATRLVDLYAQPLFKGLGTGLNSSWNYTAKTKEQWHFNFSVSASEVFTPASAQTFDITKAGLSGNIRPLKTNQTVAQTIEGSTTAVSPTIAIYNNGQQVSDVALPSGKFSNTYVPQLQATVGIFTNTDFTIRGIVPLDLGANVGSVYMLGFGLKHDIVQDFAKNSPVPFDLAVAFAYNYLNMNMPANSQPPANSLPLDGKVIDFSNQHFAGQFNSFLVQAIASKRFGTVTPFVAVGYNTSKTNVNSIGNYPITSTVLGQTYYTAITNPVSINETSIAGMQANLGLQLKLSKFYTYVSYSIAQYQSTSAGIGFDW